MADPLPVRPLANRRPLRATDPSGRRRSAPRPVVLVPLLLLLNASGCSGPSDWAADLAQPYDAEARREAIARFAASDFGGESVYVRTYREMVSEPDATIRATAIHALGLHGDVMDAPILAAALESEEAFVRREAARALQRIHNPVAIDPLIKASSLENESDADVRADAAYALGQYARSTVLEALIAALDDRSYLVVHEAQASLRTLTGQSLGNDPRRWRAWVDKQGEEAASLFADGTGYGYRPYYQPPGWLRRTFLLARDSPPRAVAPVGLEADATEEPSS